MKRAARTEPRISSIGGRAIFFATFWAAFAVVAAPVPSARATDNFPPAIKAKLGLAQDPPCAICHSGGVTGIGTVTTKFGQAMRARGLMPGDEASLKAALDQMVAEGVDSNGDGTLDIDALKQGLDPNDVGESGPVPTYGCNAVGPWSPQGYGPMAVAAIVVAAALARRRQLLPWRARSGSA